MGGQGSGRHTKLEELQSTKQILSSLTKNCAEYLRDVMVKRKFKPSWAKLKVCEYVLDRELGKAKIMAELTGAGGAPLTWQMVVLLAQKAEEAGLMPPLEAQGTAEITVKAQSLEENAKAKPDTELQP